MISVQEIKKVLQNKPKSTAKIVGQDLVVSMPDALKPSVWKTNLSDTRSALFEVDKEADVFVLVMKTENKKEIINSFSEQSGAYEALNVISKALLRGGTSSKQDKTEEEEKPLGFFKSFVIFIAFFFLILMVADALSSKGEPSREADAQTEETLSPSRSSSPSNVVEGVPLSADEILQGGR